MGDRMTAPADFEDSGDPQVVQGTRPLTVGYVLKMFPRFSETFILNEILALEKRGVKVIVFSMKEPDETIRQSALAQFQGSAQVILPLAWRHFATHAACHLSCCFRSPRRYFSTMIFVLRRRTRPAWDKFLQAPYIVREARAAGVEHFHAHFASGPARQAKLASFLSGIPFSFTAHAKDLFWTGHQHGKNNKLKKRLRSADFVVAISEYNRRFIESLDFKVPHRRVVTIYNGLDLSKWALLRPDGRPASRGGLPLLLAVGRLVPKKGFHVLVEACGLLKAAGERFDCVIVGAGPEGGTLRRAIEQAGLEDCVHLPGAITQDRLLADYFPRAALLVQPSVVSADGDQDGIPMVILEAMAVGLPVVSTAVSGIAEAVIHETTGLLVAPGDARGLAESMRRILRDPKLAGRLAAGGRAHIETHFDLKNSARLLHHLMEVSARGAVRWSNDKLRSKIGLSALEQPEPEEAERHASAQV